jgi:hypothetical protein
MSRKNSRRASLWPPIILFAIASIGLTGACLGIGPVLLNASSIQAKLVDPLMRLIMFLGIGLLVGQALETTGWTSKLAKWVRPMTTWANLKDESAASFVTSFVSGIAANTLLVTYYQENKISRKELVLTYLLNNGVPMFLLHLPTTFFIVVSLAGKSGAIYLILTLVASLLRSATILGICRLKLPRACWMWSPIIDESEVSSERTIAKIWNKFKDRFLRVALYTAPIYAIVFLLNEYGLFKWMRHGLAGSISGELIPVEAAGMVIFSLAAEFGAGMAAAGALLSTGALTEKQAAIALIVGTIISTPIRTLRHQVPTHLGLFNVALGTRLLALSQGFRVISLIVVTSVYAVFF